MGLKDKISSFLSIDLVNLDKIISTAPFKYKLYEVDKRSGGKRTISHPSKETKAVQYAIMEIVLCHLPVHNAATAYRVGLSSPLYKNASVHAPFGYTVKLDFEDFFPSIHPEDLFKTIEDHFGVECLKPDDKKLLINALFIRYRGQKSLAIGAPSPLW